MTKDNKKAELPENYALPTADAFIVDKVFGMVIPQERNAQQDGREDLAIQEAWYQENRPPHYDR